MIKKMEVKDKTLEKIMAEQTSTVQLCFEAGAHVTFQIHNGPKAQCCSLSYLELRPLQFRNKTGD